VAEVRLAVDVINRGGDVKPFVHRTAVWPTGLTLAITGISLANLF